MDSKEYWREHREHRRKSQTPEETMGDFWNAFRESKKERREQAFQIHHAEIKKLGIPHEVKNSGHHIIFNFKGALADFWPASGKWCDRKSGRYGIGLHRLLKIYGVNGE